jgi:hypothetical protein
VTIALVAVSTALALGSSAEAANASATKTFKPARSWTWVETDQDGDQYATTLRVGNFTRWSAAPQLPGLRTDTLGSDCPLNSKTDALAPAALTMTNETPGQPELLSTNIRRMTASFGGGTDIWIVANYGTGVNCFDLGSESSGGESWEASWNGLVAPHHTTVPIYAFLVIRNYFTTRHPSGNSALVRNAILELDYDRYDPPRVIISLRGPGVLAGRGSADLFLPLVGLSGKLPCTYRGNAFAGQWHCGS